MKSIVLIIFSILVASNVKAAEICFKKSNNIDARVSLPETVCLIDLELDGNTLIGGLSQDGDTVDFANPRGVLVNEGFQGFTAELLVDVYEDGVQCSERESATLTVFIPTTHEMTRIVEYDYIKVEATVRKAVDFCTDRYQSSKVTYRRI